MTTLEEKKLDAENFLSEQIQKLDPEQKKKLSYVLYGANMANGLLRAQQTPKPTSPVQD